jgi:hypothetical protein
LEKSPSEPGKKDVDLVLPGHGEPTDSSIFAELISNLDDMKQIMDASSKPEDLRKPSWPAFRIIGFGECWISR